MSNVKNISSFATHFARRSALDFLKWSLQNYQHGLALSGAAAGDVTRHVFRCCSIWLKNSDEPGVNKIMGKCAETVKSYMFVPLIYQLFSRVGSGNREVRFMVL